jgi:hypothetical protein
MAKQNTTQNGTVHKQTKEGELATKAMKISNGKATKSER